MKTVFVFAVEDVLSLVVLVGIIVWLLAFALKHFIQKWKIKKNSKKRG